TQYAPALVREVATPVVEILGGIPTVVYGYFALVTVTPILKALFGQDTVEVFNALSASIVVGISILPMVSSLSADSLRVVPISIKNAGYALGMSKFHVITKIAIPAAFSGIIASFILAFARAVGETMAVTLAAGATPTTAWDFFHGIQTMTAFIVQISLGDASAGSIEYFTRYALGLTLFILTFGFNFIATRIVRRFREVYQ
ncbi:MAG: ABC transporter permease subunit, partial [Leptospiraceae bacterium]|nr:ABC transporter permease subunit [Leptospiraceae bacterium]